MHSLRHRMKDKLRNTGCPEAISLAILGHSTNTVAANYGSGYALEVMREHLERVRLIRLPCQRSLNAASVFCRFSLFTAWPPRNCPPSSENRPEAGLPLRQQLRQPLKRWLAHSPVWRWRGLRLTGPAPRGPPAPPRASRLCPFVVSFKICSRSTFQTACAFVQLSVASRWAWDCSRSCSRSAAIKGASHADLRSPLCAIVRA